MKKLIWLVLPFLVLGIFYFKKDIPKENIKEENNQIEEKVNELLNKMSIDEKIAQMLIISFKGTSLDDDLKETLMTYKPGGVIFFKDNLSDYENSKKLIENIKMTNDIPLFIAVDEEGGKVQRLENLAGLDYPNIPSQALLGQINNPSLTYQVGQVLGQKLRLLGFNLDFAPVVDTLTSSQSPIGTRSFASDPSTVAMHGLNMAKGLSSVGIIPCFKHFPNHGSTKVDSHYDLPILKETKEELEKGLLPFKTAIKNGASIIMVGHLALPNVTQDNVPASLSKEIITDLLKTELGYKGLVITDALNMEALTKNYKEKEIYEMAINAGVDILLMPKTIEGALKLIKESLDDGVIKEEQINSSVKKILSLKVEKLFNEKEYYSLSKKEIQKIMANF